MFQQARIKLTAWYLLIIMLISIPFSLVIYRMLSIEIERFARSQRFRIERQMNDNPPLTEFRLTNIPTNVFPDIDLVDDAKHRVAIYLIVVNGSIFFFSGILGYILAGITLRPIKEMIDEQNQFITDASHELRTPLTSIKSAVEVNLRDKKLTIANAKKLLLENMKDVDRLERLSNQLLELAQYQKPNGNIHLSALPLSPVIKEAVRNVEAFATKRSIQIKNNVENHSILGNTNEIIDVFVILIENAVKYSKPKSTVTLSSSQKNGWVTITVSDQGFGIAKTDVPHIFDRFYRADNARSKTDSEGYGLGLSIAKQIVSRHHGSIQCESTVGKGSVFTVRFPMTAG